jgi:hypothetical protein
MSYARDVLSMIGRGLQQGIIKSPDIEMLLSDGPKRVPLIQLVFQALDDLPPPLTGPDAEQIPEPPRARPTPPSSHPALAAANEWCELTAQWDRLPFGTRRYYDELAKCDAAWERIAAALKDTDALRAEVVRAAIAWGDTDAEDEVAGLASELTLSNALVALAAGSATGGVDSTRGGEQ